jgi:hypothetical protein
MELNAARLLQQFGRVTPAGTSPEMHRVSQADRDGAALDPYPRR